MTWISINWRGRPLRTYFKDPADQHITLPATLRLAQQPTATAAPYPNVHFVVPAQAGTIYDLGFSTTNMTTHVSRSWSIEMTRAWIASKFPPLGWSVSPTNNTNVDWYPSVAPGTMFDHVPVLRLVGDDGVILSR